MSRELDPVRVVITTEVVMADLFTVDGVALQDGDDVLVAIPGSTENGPYMVVENGLWYRREDWEEEGQMLPHSHVTVLEGTVNFGSSWYFSNPQMPTKGVTVLNWEQRDYGTALSGGNLLQVDASNGQLERVESGVDPGSYTSPTMTINEFGDVIAAEPGLVPITFIEGLEVSYEATNNFTLRSGAAWIPGLEVIIDLPDDYPKVGNSFLPTSTYYIYFYQNVTVADYEFSTQKPAAPYRGVASVKGGPNNTTPDLDPDDTRRLLATFNTDASGIVIPASVGLIGGVGSASDTQQGLVELATPAEVQAGTDTFRAVTPAGLQARSANESRAGIIEIATQGETNAGADDTRAVTPAKLGGRIATETNTGFVEIATQAETDAGIDDQRAVTPKKLGGRVATETNSGFAEIATQGETDAGTDNTRYITPLKLAGRTATETRSGLTQKGNQAAVDGGADDFVYITPLKLRNSYASTTRPGVVEQATTAETQAGVDDTRYISPAKLEARLIGDTVLIGEMRMWGGSPSVDPAGGLWMICDGREVSRTTYSALFAVLGTNYGTGNGTTTFNLPDMRGRSPIGYNGSANPNGTDTARTGRVRGDEAGSETHALSAGEMPSHNHGGTRTTDSPGGHNHDTWGVKSANSTPAGGSFDVLRELGLSTGLGSTGRTSTAGGHTHDVSLTSNGSDVAHNNVHPVQTVLFIIRALA